MASLKATRATAPAFMPNDGRAHWISDKVVLGASPGVGTPGVGDTLDFLIPAGSFLADLAFVNDACDTNGAPTLAGSVGYRPVSSNDGSLAANATYFQAAGSIFRAAGRTEMVFKPIKFEQDVYVTVTITAVSATLPGTNPEIVMVAGVNAVGPK